MTALEQYALPGDKVRVKQGDHAGKRGIVVAVGNDDSLILLDDQAQVHVRSVQLTNYSLAARRAWAVMPKRAGRPKSSKPAKKMVSIRLRTDLWDRMETAVQHGLISSREEAVNRWIEERLDHLEDQR